MSLIQQTQKTFDGRKQDHGDAAEQRGHFNHYKDANLLANRGITQNDTVVFKANLDEQFSNKPSLDGLYAMTPAQLEAEADKILEEETEWSTFSQNWHVGDDGEEATPYQPDFATEAELGVKSKHEIRQAMSRKAIDVDFDDDHGDPDYHVPVRVSYRP